MTSQQPEDIWAGCTATGVDGIPVTLHIGVLADMDEALTTRNRLMDLLERQAKVRTVLVNGTDVWMVMAPMPPP